MSPSAVTRPIDRDRQAPRSQTARTAGLALGPTIAQHPLLGLRDHHLERRHPGSRRGIASRSTPIPVPARSAVSEVAQRDAAGAEVLEAHDEAPLDQLERRLDEELLGERVADLDGRPLGRVIVPEGRTGEDRCAADAVAAGRRAEQDDEVARTRARGQRQASARRAGRWP